MADICFCEGWGWRGVALVNQSVHGTASHDTAVISLFDKRYHIII